MTDALKYLSGTAAPRANQRANMLIAKSTFLQFQICPKDTWLRLHKPELVEVFAPTEFEKHLMEQGNEVEAYARQLFPGASMITATGDDAVAETRRLMETGTDAILQGTLLADGFYAKCDVLKRNPHDGTWDIYEIKGTNSLKEGSEDRDHISDLAFQRHVLTLDGVKVGRAYIVHLNKEYVRRGALDISTLFTVADSTDLVEDVSDAIKEEMVVAREYLNREIESNVGCDCHLKGRSAHCRTFAYSHPEIPEYSVHDISRIGQSKKKLADLVDRRIYALDDVPDDYKLGDAQKLQIKAHKVGRPLIQHDAIGAALREYTFPLHFFDYETFAPAIPAFDGFSPYRRIPFQFSLHILREPDGEPEHIEYLHLDGSDPSSAVAQLLSQHIDPKGSVVVWYAPFERGVNKEIGERLTGHAAVMQRINDQVRDLRDVFAKQQYVHPEFRGKTSIKSVLPVLVPEMSYEDLAIKEGATASERWWMMTDSATPAAERAKIAGDLRAYCKQDSYAMYAIWKVLRGLR